MKKFLIFIMLVLSAKVYCDDFVNQKLNEQDELIDNILLLNQRKKELLNDDGDNV